MDLKNCAIYRVFKGMFVSSLVCLAFSASAEMQTPAMTTVTIGTGGVTGVYYPAGGAVCRLVNRQRSEHGIRCAVRATGGTIFNLQSLRSGDLDLGLAQSDWHFHAVQGTSSSFSDVGPDTGLRSVFSLHSEAFTVLARADSDIHSLDDLSGKRVNIGNPGSGQYATMQMLMALKGWGLDEFSEVNTLGAVEQASALCDNRIDATVYTVGHPSGVVQEATTTCDVRIIQVTGEVVETLLAEHPYYRLTRIPGGLYRGNDRPVDTFGLVATLVTHESVPEPVIYTLVQSVFDDIDAFRALHPAFSELDPAEMVQDALTAPLHPGALRYYEEQGLIPDQDG